MSVNDQAFSIYVALENGDVAAAEKRVPLISDPFLLASVINLAAFKGFVSIIETALQNPATDLNISGSDALLLAVEEGHLEVINLFVQDARLDASWVNNRALFKATEVANYIFCNKNDANARFLGIDSKKRRFDIVDLLYREPSVYRSIDYHQVHFYCLQMFRSRMLEICIGLQSLYLPDLQTLKIIDYIIFNCVRRFAKIELIRKVKHFKV